MSNNENKIIKELDHHCFVLVGDISFIKQSLFSDLENFGIYGLSNPDFTVLETDNFSVKDCEELISKSNLKSFSDGEKVFVCIFNTISVEAQNKLLKTIEEPPKGVRFFLISPQNTFLPTILSRSKLILISSKQGFGESGKGFGGILEMSLVDKLEFVSKLVKDINDEKQQKQKAIDVVNGIESELNFNEADKLIANKEKLLACKTAKKRLLQRGAMTKMILESLMLHL
jgi:DNA polymerase III delta prime subunit